MTEFSKRYISILSSPRDFAIYCTIRRALRQHVKFMHGGPGLIVLLVPNGHKVERYIAAATVEIYGIRPNHTRSDVGLMTVEKGEKHHRIMNGYLAECQDKRRSIILSEVREDLPAPVLLAADQMIDVPAVTARDLRAACMVALKLNISLEEAEEALQYPIENVYAALRHGRTMKEVLRRLAEHVPVGDAPKQLSLSEIPALGEMHGYGVAKEWGLQLAQDLSDWRDGKIDWADLDKGILLSGPPGVGKSIFAKALAKQCDVHLVATSLGQWQASGHLGDLLKSMRADFAKARERAPSILFIDELDSVGDRRKFSDDHKGYSVQVVNALLESLDGLGGREGVVVVGATNNPADIDPAVLRSGRLDRQVEIPMPSAEDRIAILEQHLGYAIPETSSADLKAATAGMTGADLVKVSRDARRIARQEKRKILVDDIQAALPPVFKIEGDYRHAIAIHEAGHTVVGIRLGHGKYVGTSIADQIVVGSGIQQAGAAYFEMPTIGRRDRQFYLNWIALTLAGLAAEEVVLGGRGDGAGLGKGSDLATATKLATMVEGTFGMGTSFRHSLANDDKELEQLRASDHALSDRVDGILREQFDRAKAIVEEDHAFVGAVAMGLMEDCQVTPENVKKMMVPARSGLQQV